MSRNLARILVFSSAAAVLVLEILAGRLLAPYLGLSLEVFTGIIGTVLAGIALGAWAGGRAADAYEPRKLIGPLLAAGGVLALLSPPLVDWIGPSMRAAGPGEILTLTAVAFFAPAAVLSAVSPIVVKIRLADLSETGAVVGSFSAIGTAGAIFGTFITGFVLISAWPSRPVVFVVGGGLVLWGAILTGWKARSTLIGIVLPAALGGLLLATVDGPCEVETAYHCAYVTADPDRPNGRTLWLDTLRHSYVDIADPTHLEFRYTKVMIDVIEATGPEDALDVLFIGGGGFTLPRYFPAVRPGSISTVLEIDTELVDFVESELGLDRDDPAMIVHTGDARLLIEDEPADAFELIVGDAFGGLAVPWHLTTEEFTELVADRLTEDGLYLINLIDRPPNRFARAEAATLLEVFDHVAVAAPQLYFDNEAGGNFVTIASHSPIDVDTVATLIGDREGAEVVLSGEALAAFVGDALVLTDDFAPVDQLIGRR